MLRQAQREAERRAKVRRQALVAGSSVVVLVFVAVIVLVVVTSSGKKKPTTAAAAGCTYTASPSAVSVKSYGLPPDKAATGQHTLTLQLAQGTVTAALSPQAPCTVNSFQFLASHGYFTNTSCHRLVTSGIYVLQCGDPSGTGEGGPGYTIPDENLTGATYPAGTLAMANTGQAHTGGSQFFIVYKQGELSPAYTPFGTITSGLDVIAEIAAAGVQGGGSDGKPKDAVTIKSFAIS